MLRDLLGNRTTDELLEDTAILFQKVKKIVWKDLRPWNEFFAVFNLPQGNSRQIEQRVSTNLIHYRSNYSLISISIFLCQIVISPVFFLSLTLVISIFTYFFFVQKRSIKIGDTTINERTKLIICGVTSFILMVLTRTLEYLIWDCLFCLIICSLHALFRPRSITAKDDQLSEQLKMNGFHFHSGNSTSGKRKENNDPENPIVDDEPIQFSATNPLNTGAVRKRAANVSSVAPAPSKPIVNSSASQKKE